MGHNDLSRLLPAPCCCISLPWYYFYFPPAVHPSDFQPLCQSLCNSISALFALVLVSHHTSFCATFCFWTFLKLLTPSFTPRGLRALLLISLMFLKLPPLAHQSPSSQLILNKAVTSHISPSPGFSCEFCVSVPALFLYRTVFNLPQYHLQLCYPFLRRPLARARSPTCITLRHQRSCFLSDYQPPTAGMGGSAELYHFVGMC